MFIGQFLLYLAVPVILLALGLLISGQWMVGIIILIAGAGLGTVGVRSITGADDSKTGD